jgi:indole-3-glycerol phosphate synthase
MKSEVLKKILSCKKEEVKKRKKRGLFFRPFWERAPFCLKAYLESRSFTVIAEVKRASPSKGLLKKKFNPLTLARAYERAGAGMISVITEEDFFLGSLEYLAAIRAHTSLPLLRKDFIFDPVQIEEAKAFGADAVLLIVAALKKGELKELIKYSKRLGLSSLVEVHNEEELETALSCGAEVIGVNNRDLKSLKVDTSCVLRLFPLVPKGMPVIAESGYQEPSEVRVLKEQGIKGVLIGTSLVSAKSPGEKLREIIKEVES